MDSSTAQISIHGRVQGVWFRVFTRNQGIRFHINGWVKNMADGSVYCEAQGTEENIRLFIHELHRGPELGNVERVNVSYTQTHEVYTEFEIKH